jgi:hypothetical protein
MIEGRTGENCAPGGGGKMAAGTAPPVGPRQNKAAHDQLAENLSAMEAADGVRFDSAARQWVQVK